jgi:hypothetical protein
MTNKSDAASSTQPCDHECGVEDCHEICTCAKCGFMWPNGEVKIVRTHGAASRTVEQPMLLREFRVALQRVTDGEQETCGCEHDDENCCERVDEFCPHCIAGVALAKETRTVEQPEKPTVQLDPPNVVHGPLPSVLPDLIPRVGQGSPILEPSVAEREPQWANCPRCRQKVLAPHECYESVLNEGEREEFEKRYGPRPTPMGQSIGNNETIIWDLRWETWRAARKGK